MDGRAEFIGEYVEVIGHSDPSIQGISGLIINETRETLMIKTEDGKKTVSKRPAHFLFKNGDIIGKKVAYRPQDRIKKVKS